MNRFPIALDFATAFFQQDFMLIVLGIVMHHGRRIRSERSLGTRHNHLRFRTFYIGRRGEVYRSGCDRNRYIRLLLIVGRVLFDDDQRILFYRVIGAVSENNFGHAFGAGLHYIAFFERHIVVGIDPAVAISFSYPNGAVERREIGVLPDSSRWPFEWRR